MGQCSSSGMSREYTVYELADLPINGLMPVAGCAPDISGTQGGSGLDWLQKRGLSWPQNGEFAFGGLSNSCQMCSDIANGYGCSCEKSGGAAIGGRIGNIQRIAFNANPTRCCIANGTKIIDGKTCDPKYRNYTNTECDASMLAYCNNGNWGTNECRSWVQAAIANNRTIANVPLSNYCSTNSNFAKPECQEWCSIVRNNRSMRSACDMASINYCKNNSSDPLCTCQNPPETITKIQELMANAKVCWYKPCQTLSNDNYITSTMEDQKRSCVSTACLIDAGNVTISGSNNLVKFDNNCATNLLKPEYQDNPVLPSENVVSNQMLLLLFFCIVFIFLFILAVYLYKK